MEFTGRIAKVLPLRSGIGQKTGNEWKSLPFVFEYFENPTDRYADSVLLETFDTNVIENLQEGMEVRCGFGHRAKTITKQDGTPATFNELRLYKIECLALPKTASQATNSPTPVQSPTPQPNNAQEGDEEDDLPF